MLNHDALAQSLADHLSGDRRMVWCDIQLGPSGSVRPDVYALYKSFVSPCPIAYECKVSASDFRADVTTGKWQSYLRYASGVYFACEGDLLKKADVPEHCGLMVLRGTWRAAKKPVLSPVTIPEEALLKLLIDGVQREGPRYRARGYCESTSLAKMREKFGDIVARTITDRLSVEWEIEQAKKSVDRITLEAQRRAEDIRKEAIEKMEPLRSELCEILGLPADCDRYELARAVGILRDSLAQHPAQRDLKTLTNSLRRALDLHGFKEREYQVVEKGRIS